MVTVSAQADRMRVVSLLADLIDYPQPGLAATVVECRQDVVDSVPAAAILLDAFLGDIERLTAGRLEELYSNAFDLDTLSGFDATCYPYVGHHLLGESYRRSRFMVGLLERYQQHGFAVVAGELPDHLLVMLRFVARCPDEDLAEELVGEAILPALARMTQNGEEATSEGESGRRIYLRVLEAIRLVLQEQLWPNTVVCSYEPALEPATTSRGASPCSTRSC
jgi:nitrate reductase assembly molybdenum cofactor insertion protein NarJ